nr:platelet factor 4 isoform X1 [Saimiri boliviensis boliviensis]
MSSAAGPCASHPGLLLLGLLLLPALVAFASGESRSQAVRAGSGEGGPGSPGAGEESSRLLIAATLSARVLSVRAPCQALHVHRATCSAQLLSEGSTIYADAEEGDGDLQCLCVKTTSQVRPRHITSLEVIKAGPHCPNAQLIATLKNGRKICLDLQAPLYKKIVKKLLES